MPLFLRLRKALSHTCVAVNKNNLTGLIYLSVVCVKQGCCGLWTLGWANADTPPSATVVYLSGKSGSAAGTKWLPDARSEHGWKSATEKLLLRGFLKALRSDTINSYHQSTWIKTLRKSGHRLSLKDAHTLILRHSQTYIAKSLRHMYTDICWQHTHPHTTYLKIICRERCY